MMAEQKGLLAYVVHKHKATSLHYDFRLEIGAAMPSWSIPKGPSLDPAVKRLAMPTGDHTLEYRRFEGVIPAGEYGGGPVMIWDEGMYNPELEVARGVRREVTNKAEAETVAKSEHEKGNLKFRLFGKKLAGSFALVRTAGFNGKESWLLIKHKDAHCVPGYNANDYDFSAVSNRSISEIAGSTGAPPGTD